MTQVLPGGIKIEWDTSALGLHRWC